MNNPKSTSARKKNSNFWISDALKNSKKGALHKEMGVPLGQKIPVTKLKAASKSANPKLAKRARLALTLKSFH